jgi:hypothetical protein
VALAGGRQVRGWDARIALYSGARHLAGSGWGCGALRMPASATNTNRRERTFSTLRPRSSAPRRRRPARPRPPATWPGDTRGRPAADRTHGPAATGHRRLRVPVRCPNHTAGSSAAEHVMAMRRLSAGMRRLVTHRESSTHRLAMVMRGGPSGRGSRQCAWTTSSRQASAYSVPLTCSWPTACHPAGTQTSSSDRKLMSGRRRRPGSRAR